MSALVAIEGLRVRHGAQTVLDDVDLRIAKGEIVTVLGPNGSGKTTLMRAILGAVPLAGGRITHAPRLRIGYVPQKLALSPSLPLSVSRFLSLPTRRSVRACRAALAEADVAGLETREIASLSGGQLQRVLLARALLGDPQLLILDEPTTGLDQPGAAEFYRRIETLRAARGCAVLMVSHDLHVVMSASDRVICLNGHICCSGSPQAVASAPEYRALFGTGTGGALALYRHSHDHSHDHGCDHDHGHSDGADPGGGAGHAHGAPARPSAQETRRGVVR
ncbi:metal ABC transporter ATP-binding protein [Profundibacterium mesophilum]|uniref:Zinc import ATP-binding protein ZnuC n=1 Tax=Profundibacterium mesophilum KAUST100406-0324 TaxID=1037889 RepID=A0A921NY61_9RHOB|nr:metal ABC transporter ATP-binding protein [Profundibacterium mesophilum]KAF0677530.1 Zinc import ATP-binding protein ZnuC [Profundibacterium mesophilum KAUST100406-0324]